MRSSRTVESIGKRNSVAKKVLFLILPRQLRSNSFSKFDNCWAILEVCAGGHCVSSSLNACVKRNCGENERHAGIKRPSSEQNTDAVALLLDDQALFR